MQNLTLKRQSSRKDKMWGYQGSIITKYVFCKDSVRSGGVPHINFWFVSDRFKTRNTDRTSYHYQSNESISCSFIRFEQTNYRCGSPLVDNSVYAGARWVSLKRLRGTVTQHLRSRRWGLCTLWNNYKALEKVFNSTQRRRTQEQRGRTKMAKLCVYFP